MLATAHTSSPAAHLLGVQCIVCSIPLSDAKSAELGIGPICRKKWGYDTEIPGGEDARKRANGLVYAATVAKRDGDTDAVLAIADVLDAMGLTKLAGRIRDRFVDLRLTPVDDGAWVDVFTPYHQDFPYQLKQAVGADRLRRVHQTGKDDDGDPVFVRGAASDRELAGKFHHWCAPREHVRSVLLALAAVFPHSRAYGAKGVFVVPTLVEFRAAYVTKALADGTINQSYADHLNTLLRRWRA